MKALVTPAPIPREAPVTIAVLGFACVLAAVVLGSLDILALLILFQIRPIAVLL
jgi:hypothetical protein